MKYSFQNIPNKELIFKERCRILIPICCVYEFDNLIIFNKKNVGRTSMPSFSAWSFELVITDKAELEGREKSHVRQLLGRDPNCQGRSLPFSPSLSFI